MVHIDQVTNLMDQMMNVNILHPSEKLQMIKDEEKKFLDPNIIMDTRHRILRENLSATPTNGSVWMSTKKLFTQEEATQLYMKKQQRFLERELKKFELELSKARPKFLKPYTCSRRNLAPSNDDDFWRTSRKLKSKVIVEERKIQSSIRERSGDSCRKSERTETYDHSLKVKDEKCLKTTICEVPYVGSIKVTIKDKTHIDTDAERIRILKKYLDILKRNAVEERRLREIKMKIRVKTISQIMRKYFDIWRTRTKDAKDRTKKRGEEISEEGRIEMFIKAITERQRELMKSQKLRSRDDNLQKVKECNNVNTERESTCFKRIIVEPPAKCRLNAQRKIIEKQKAKLAEQSRIIEELKLKQMQEEIFKANKETLDTAKETLTHCGQKTRRSLIQLMHQNGYRDESLIVHRRVSDPPKFLLGMEARAEARRKRVKLVEELRRQKLEEQKKSDDAARIEEELKKRRLQQEAFAEARKLQKAQEENRRRERDKFQRLNGIADNFYRKFLLQHYIMEPFVTLIEQKRINIQKAEGHYREKLLKKIFTTWKAEAKNQSKRKSGIALSFYNNNLMTEMFEQWKKMTKEVNSKYQVAIDFYDMKLVDKYNKLWIVRVVESKEEFDEKAKLADITYKNKLKAKCFGIWKKYLAIAEDIKDSERRKDQLRQLVQKVIPDFNPKQRGVILED